MKKSLLFFSVTLFLICQISNSQNIGELDATFSGTGFNFGFPNVNDVAYSVIHLNDNRILLGGNASSQSGLLMFTIDGERDESFGPNGLQILNTGPSNSSIVDLKELSDGSIIVVGNTADGGYAAKINADGIVDTSFGNDGFIYNEDHRFKNAELSSDGAFIIGSLSLDIDNSIFNMSASKYDQNGNLDASFGSNGITVIPYPEDNVNTTELKINQNDEIFILAETIGDEQNMVLTKLNANGSFDSSFGNSGFVATDNQTASEDRPINLNIDTNGRIIASGYRRNLNPIGPQNLLILRLLPDGSYDDSFANNGVLRFTSTTIFTVAKTVVVQPDNKLFVYSTFSKLINLNEDGTKDESFGDDGEAFLDFFGTSIDIFDMTYQGDGKLLLAGRLNPDVDNINRYLVARVVSGVLSVDNFDVLNKIKIAPNPAGQNLNIYFSEPSTSVTEYVINDILGKEVLSITPTNIENLSITLSIDTLSKGMYFLTIYSNTSRATFKFLKE